MALSSIPISAYSVSQNSNFSLITLIDRVSLLSLRKLKLLEISPTTVSATVASVYRTCELYHCFLPHCTTLMQPLHALLSSTKPKSQTITWTDSALAAFIATKEALAKASLLSYPDSEVPTCRMTDASDTAVRAVLQQHINYTWHPFLFFSRKMTPAKTCYNTFDRELLDVYLAIKHFWHFPEGRPFHVLTNHKPLIFALNTQSDRHSPWQACHLDFISQFTSTICFIHGLKM